MAGGAVTDLEVARLSIHRAWRSAHDAARVLPDASHLQRAAAVAEDLLALLLDQVEQAQDAWERDR
jgi:hypothetical protein